MHYTYVDHDTPPNKQSILIEEVTWLFYWCWLEGWASRLNLRYLNQLCHVLISCLISESPNNVTDSRISGLEHLSLSNDHPSQSINQSLCLSGLRHKLK